MPKKEKFKPQVNRIKLNVEQAVLACTCYMDGYYGACGSGFFSGTRYRLCAGLGSKSAAGTDVPRYSQMGVS